MLKAMEKKKVIYHRKPRVINKSKSYLLPLFVTDIFVNEYDCVPRMVSNTYLFSNVYANADKCLYIEIDYDLLRSAVDVEKFIGYLRSTGMLLSCFYDNYQYPEYLYVCLEVPPEFERDYDMYLQGKYSKFSDNAKACILIFFKEYFSDYMERIHVMRQILYKSRQRRKTLEKVLGVELDDETELDSIYDKGEETLKL